MGDKDESVSRLDSLLNRILVFDGGGRRRLTAGAIVVATILMTFPDAHAIVTGLIEARDASVSLILAASALLIYAVGVVVELIGEVFLVRAVGNAVWSYTSAAHQIKKLRCWKKYVAYIPTVVLYGTPRAFIYCLSGLFGKCVWQMPVAQGLSKEGRARYIRLPRHMRHAIRQALGPKSDFGRMALVSFLTPERRSWAQGLLTRPRDVLTLVSAIVFSFTLAIFGAPSRFHPSEENTKSFASAQQEFIASHSILEAAWTATGAAGTPVLIPHSDEEYLRKILAQLVLGLNAAAPLAFNDGQFARALDQAHTNLLARRSVWVSRDFCVDRRPGPSEKKAMDDAMEQYRTAVMRVDNSVLSLLRTYDTAKEEFRSDESRKFVLHILAATATLVLYVAFFSSLRSATLSVLEALELDHQDTAKSKDHAGPNRVLS